MSRPYRRGLVVGKFCPLHLGHEFLIGQAREACDELLVLSYTSQHFAGCESDRRAEWLRLRFTDVESHVLDGVVAGRPLPDDADDGDVHRRFVAWWLKEVRGTTVDAVFTSEDYGDGFAAVLAEELGVPVRHVCVDRARTIVPVSGTQVRRDPHAWRGMLAPEVYASFVARVAFLGGESTGKTTLAQRLARELGTAWAPEYGRELWEAKQGALEAEDMPHIARTQVAREEALARQANRVLLCDTTPLTTALYSEALFASVDPALQRLAQRRYDLLFLCAPDFDFVQDGTRKDEAFRSFQHGWYERVLREEGIAHIVLGGSLEERVAAAKQRIEALPPSSSS